MSMIRAALVAGKFRTHHQLLGTNADDQRNTLIVELAGHSRASGGQLQGMNDADLAAAAAVMLVLKTTGIRDHAGLKAMSLDDQRNTLIVELAATTGLGQSLQGFSNIDLVAMSLGHKSGSLSGQHYYRGVLAAGQFRTNAQLNTMTIDDQRNTLIVEMAGHSNQTGSSFQAMNDRELAGAGAITVAILIAGIRTRAQLQTISTDDQRNIFIVELDAVVNRGRALQGLDSLALVQLAMGIEPPAAAAPRSRPYRFSVGPVVILEQKADNSHSDSDFLSIFVTIGKPQTAEVVSLPPVVHHIGSIIKTGRVIDGPFKTEFFDADDADLVIVTCVLMNLGSSRAEDQFKEAVQITDKIVSIAGPVIGGIVGLVLGGQVKEGIKIGKQVADAFSEAIAVLSDIFDFLGLHVGAPNCNGLVLQEVTTFQPGELARAAGQPFVREITGPQENDRCGSPPRTRINMLVKRIPAEGLVSPDF